MKRLLVLMLPLLVMMSACSKDSNKGNEGGEEGDGGKTEQPNGSKNTNLLFTVSVPAQVRPNTAGTYALDDIDENNVSVVNVLAFKDNAGTMELADWAKTIDGSIEDVGGDVDRKSLELYSLNWLKTQLTTSL